MVDLSQKFDVLVIGGGNAALCAAISARRAGASVLVLEGAPKFYRGGNTRHTRNMRCAHDAATDILTGPYTEEEFWDDLLRLTGGQTDEELARHMIRESKDILDWIVKQGVRWQPSLGGTLSLGRTNSFFLGGGRAMLNTLYLTAESLGIEVRYDAEVVDVEIDAGAPKFDGGIITRLDCVIFGIVVNKQAQRFYDEGEDIWPKRYAIWGRLVAAQPDQIAYIVFDAKSLNLFMPSLFPSIQADTVRE